ncbi:MAG: winged helix-turn-helix transcriptional regulator [Pirellulales bacterium]|nr:winged helix-turn-helix transcriptional regulator [Pirellulales bacterium]
MSPDAQTVALLPPFALTIPPAAAKNECLTLPPLAAAPGNIMREFMAITKALADENRVRFLLALQNRELCLCQIVELAGLAPSTVSKHMSILKQARLVESRKDGRWMYYRLAGRDAPPTARRALGWIFHALADDPQILLDQKRLKKVLKLDPQALCESQCSHAPTRSS